MIVLKNKKFSANSTKFSGKQCNWIVQLITFNQLRIENNDEKINWDILRTLNNKFTNCNRVWGGSTFNIIIIMPKKLN